MRLRDQLLTVSEAYASAIARSEARVSTLVFGSGNAISRVRDGADMGSERIHDALQWFSNHWPDEAEWPSSVDRPAPVSGTNESGSEPPTAGGTPTKRKAA